MLNNINWNTAHAAIFRSKTQTLKAVDEIDTQPLESLIRMEDAKNKLVQNTQRFLSNTPAHHALLWGSRGTGKSSLVKAVFAAHIPQGLRLIQIAKEDLGWLPEISDLIRPEPYYFLIFCDDLGFESSDENYRGLKSVLEGGIEKPPKNLLIYATSNRRHLLPEYMDENRADILANGEIHYGDAIEEKISLSDRFGLWISFYQGNLQEYLDIVDSYFPNFTGERSELHQAAKLFAQNRTSHSGRTAKQFWQYMAHRT